MEWLQTQPATNKSYSATTEEEARNVAESANSKKVVKIKKKKYLVKWRGLSYKDCTWETVKDINDDEKIAEYHALNDSPPDEPPLTQAEIGIELAKGKNQSLPPIRYPSTVQDVDAEIYAQVRALHFLRWNRAPPRALLNECGPSVFGFTHNCRPELLLPKPFETIINSIFDPTVSSENRGWKQAENSRDDDKEKIEMVQSNDADSKKGTVISEEEARIVTWVAPKLEPAVAIVEEEVAGILGTLVHCVSRGQRLDPYPVRPRLPPPRAPMTEIEVCVPKGKHSLSMKIGCVKNRHVVMGFRLTENGKRGAAELTGRIKIGDVLLAVNTVSVVDCTPTELSKIISDVETPFMYLRILRCSAASYLERLRKLRTESGAPAAQNGQPSLPNQSAAPSAAPSAAGFDIVAEYLKIRPSNFEPSARPITTRSMYFGVFPIYRNRMPFNAAITDVCWSVELFDESFKLVSGGVYDDEHEAAKAYDKLVSSLAKQRPVNFTSEGELTDDVKPLHRLVTRERELNAARHVELSNRSSVNDKSLKDDQMNVEASKVGATKKSVETEEKGLDTDGENEGTLVDSYFSDDSRDSDSYIASSDEGSESEEAEESEEEYDSDSSNESEERERRSVKVSKPSADNTNGPLCRLLRAVNETEYPPNRQEWSNFILEMGSEKWSSGPNVSSVALKSGSRIDQMDMASGVVIDTWDSINAASRQLGITPAAISACLLGKADDAGGFKWRVSSSANASASAGQDDEEEATDDKKDEAWKNKLYTKTKEYRSGGTLRDYQLNGLNWLLRCWYSKRSSILADEMGKQPDDFAPYSINALLV
jgi:hypothetical protein